jgi:hypothetical protein
MGSGCGAGGISYGSGIVQAHHLQSETRRVPNSLSNLSIYMAGWSCQGEGQESNCDGVVVYVAERSLG